MEDIKEDESEEKVSSDCSRDYRRKISVPIS